MGCDFLIETHSPNMEGTSDGKSDLSCRSFLIEDAWQDEEGTRLGAIQGRGDHDAGLERINRVVKALFKGHREKVVPVSLHCAFRRQFP